MLLSACGVPQDKYDALQAQNQQLQQQVANDQARIGRLRGAIKYTVNSDLLFPSGSWTMSDDGKDVISKMAKTLASSMQEKLLVKGFTDNAPIGPGLQRLGVMTNQDLSQKRAESVMQFIVSQGVRQDLLTAQGFGETQPVATNSTPQGRAQNRRVEITIAGSGS